MKRSNRMMAAGMIVAGVLVYGPVAFALAIWKVFGGSVGWESLFCGGAAFVCAMCVWICLVAVFGEERE